MNRRSLIRNATSALALAWVGSTLPLRAAAAAFGDEAKVFIESLADKAVSALTDTQADRRQREKRFRVLLVDHFAVAAIGRFVLGRYWRRASDSQREEYMKLFEDFIVLTYVGRFSEYSGETLSVLGAITGEGKDAIVNSEIMRTGGQPPIRVDWRVKGLGESFKIVDVVVEGVSMSQAQRSDFGSVIKQNGGRIEGLLEALREKTAQMRTDNG